MVNKVILIGRVGRDPERRTFSNGDGVVSFSLATTESWRDKSSGDRKERTEWHNVQSFNEGISKIIESYVKKGSRLYIEGQIQTREYTDKDGNQRKVTEIVIPRFGGALELLDSKSDDREESHATAPARKELGRQRSLKDELDDSIPF
jgi:single-strand DNA-binding protein